MASQVQLANTFNEFRQAYNTAANDITELQTSNTTLFDGNSNLYANTIQNKDLDSAGGRVLISRAPISGTGALIDDDAGLVYDTASNRLTVDGAIDASGSLRSANVTANNLTSGRVVIAGTSGLIQDNSKLTFNTSNNCIITGNAVVETQFLVANNAALFSNGNAILTSANISSSINANTATVTSLTASKPVFTDASKVLTSSGTLLTDQGGTGLSSYTAGDLSYYSSGTAFSKLAIGTANTVLTSTGSAPQWSTNLNFAALVLSGNLTLSAATSTSPAPPSASRAT